MMEAKMAEMEEMTAQQLEKLPQEEEKLEQATESGMDERRLMEVAELAARLTLIRQSQWEQAAGEDLLLARELRKIHPGEDTAQILARLNEARDCQAARQLGMTPEELMALRERLLHRREQMHSRHCFAQSLLQQEKKMRMTQPGFDLAEHVRKYPAFRALILAGEPVERALAYLNPQAGQKMAEQQIAQRMKRRAGRPKSLSAPGPSRRQITVDTMSEADLRRIDEKLKRGEHVRLG